MPIEWDSKVTRTPLLTTRSRSTPDPQPPPYQHLPSTEPSTTTSRARSGFDCAPESVRAAFFRELGRRLDEDREQNAALEEAHGIEIPTTHHPLRWDESWNRRGRAIRRARLHPEDDWTPDRAADPLIGIPAAMYVEALTGIEVPKRGGAIRCPLPDHDDHSPSFAVFRDGWRCYGCGKSGTIYDLAAVLWGIHPRGRGFVEIHKRLRAVFA